MASEDTTLTCTVIFEYLDAKGSILRKITHRVATLRLIRNANRQILIEVIAEKANVTKKFLLKGISVFNKFMTEGKATIKFIEEKCTIFLSNAPAAQLVNFLKMIFIKMSGENETKKKNPREEILSKKNHLVDISPLTNSEIQNAKEKISKTRTTVTTPSPSNVRKRKLTNENTKLSMAKKLYANPTTLIMTDEQKNILQAVLNGKNVFFTGSAGTGKSFLLKRIIAGLPPDVTITTASTGVAACHIGGITLHQFAGIGIGTGTLEKCYELASRPSVASIWKKTKHLIIDEISMVDGNFFDKIESVARFIRKNDKPFGGIQLIICGDFFQLPPVSKNEKNIKFCFQSKAWNICIQNNYELEIVHRQKDPIFIKLLNNIRIGRVTNEISNILKSTAKQKIEKNGILATRLCTHIKEADEINNYQIDKLEGEKKLYIAQDSDENFKKILDQQLIVPEKLILKIGAQVMLLKNINVNNGLVNGARGIVKNFIDGIPNVLFCSGDEYLTKIEKWTIKTSAGGFIHRKQIPLKLAWAFSIHKSQGLTLDCVEMCLNRVFDPGQAYVALSRAQSLNSLRILDFNNQQVWADKNVLEFYKKFRRHLHDIEFIPIGKKARLK